MMPVAVVVCLARYKVAIRDLIYRLWPRKYVERALARRLRRLAGIICGGLFFVTYGLTMSNLLDRGLLT